MSSPGRDTPLGDVRPHSPPSSDVGARTSGSTAKESAFDGIGGAPVSTADAAAAQSMPPSGEQRLEERGATNAAAAQSSPVPLPAIDTLSLDSDYSPFMQSGVDESLKRGALKKLFSDARFNVMDGLDVYIDDYSKPDPIDPDIVRTLVQARYIFNPPRTRVNEQGYVEDVQEDAALPAGEPEDAQAQPAEPQDREAITPGPENAEVCGAESVDAGSARADAAVVDIDTREPADGEAHQSVPEEAAEPPASSIHRAP